MSLLQTGLTLRTMTLDDLPQVYRIELDSFTLPWPFNSYVYELTESKVSRCFVAATIDATGHKKILGMIVIYLIEDEAHVATFAVHKDFRHEGIGWRLLHHALKESAQDGASHAFLEVRASNRPAIDLYDKFGFLTVNVRKKYYADNNEDALLMNLDALTFEKLTAIEAHFSHSNPDQPDGGNHDA
jgi:[ribosomal protein S18]-alanine N-acetyltransferase